MDRTQFENSAPFGRSEKISALKMNVPVLGDGDRHIEGDKRSTCSLADIRTLPAW